MKSLKTFLIWGIVVLVGVASFTTLTCSGVVHAIVVLPGGGLVPDDHEEVLLLARAGEVDAVVRAQERGGEETGCGT